MANMTDLKVTLTALTLGVTALSQAQPAAFNRYKQRLARLNVNMGSVVASGIVAGQAGAQFDVPIAFVPGTSQVSALQFDLLLPVGFTIVSATAGPAAIAAQKSVQTNPANGRTIVFGLNQTVLGEGSLLTLRMSTTSTIVKRSYPIGITNVSGANPDGIEVPVSGESGPVKIQ